MEYCFLPTDLRYRDQLRPNIVLRERGCGWSEALEFVGVSGVQWMLSILHSVPPSDENGSIIALLLFGNNGTLEVCCCLCG